MSVSAFALMPATWGARARQPGVPRGAPADQSRPNGRRTYLALVERGRLDLSLLLKAVDDVAVRPSDLVRKALRVEDGAQRDRVQWS